MKSVRCHLAKGISSCGYIWETPSPHPPRLQQNNINPHKPKAILPSATLTAWPAAVQSEEARPTRVPRHALLSGNIQLRHYFASWLAAWHPLYVDKSWKRLRKDTGNRRERLSQGSVYQTEGSRSAWAQAKSSLLMWLWRNERRGEADTDHRITVTQALWKADVSVNDYTVSGFSQGKLSSLRYLNMDKNNKQTNRPTSKVYLAPTNYFEEREDFMKSLVENTYVAIWLFTLNPKMYENQKWYTNRYFEMIKVGPLVAFSNIC